MDIERESIPKEDVESKQAPIKKKRRGPKKEEPVKFHVSDVVQRKLEEIELLGKGKLPYP